jgi:4-amino-4-deoxy-L-arabinose transferase-like glycosyltransferase
MDAVLALDGKIPVVEYMSREPLYVYSFAAYLKLFGVDFILARFWPAACSLLVGFVTYLLAKALFDAKVALLAAAIYWMLPLELFQSVKITTEPLVMLLTCLAFYTVVKFSQTSQPRWLAVAGVLSALGFYARNSSIIIPVAVFIFVALFCEGRARDIARTFGYFLAGYVSMIFLVVAFYSRFTTLADLFYRLELNPLSFIPWSVEQLTSAQKLGSDAPFWPSELFIKYVVQTTYLHSFLMIALVFSGAQFGYRFMTSDSQMRREMIPRSILYWWALTLLVAYAFYSYLAGFIIDYSREFFPPLVIIFAAWLYASIPALRRDGNLERFVMGGLCLSALLFFMHANRRDFLGMGHHAALTVALLALFTFAGSFGSLVRRLTFSSIMTGIVAYIAISERVPDRFPSVPSVVVIGIVYGLTWIFLRAKDGSALQAYGRFVCLSMVLASFIVNISYSGTLLSPTYNAEWSPELVEKIASYVKSETDPSDEVISGAVIWEFHAQRRPFRKISHPFELEFASEDKKAGIRQAAETRPPRVIILDGWTERLYLRHVPVLTELLANRYQQIPMAAGPAAFEVKVYRLKEEPYTASGNM